MFRDCDIRKQSAFEELKIECREETSKLWGLSREPDATRPCPPREGA